MRVADKSMLWPSGWRDRRQYSRRGRVANRLQTNRSSSQHNRMSQSYHITGIGSSPDKQYRAAEQLLRILDETPSLDKHVKSLTFGTSGEHEWDGTAAQKTPSAQQWPRKLPQDLLQAPITIEISTRRCVATFDRRGTSGAEITPKAEYANENPLDATNADKSPYTKIIRRCTGLEILRRSYPQMMVAHYTSIPSIAPPPLMCVRTLAIVSPLHDAAADCGCYEISTNALIGISSLVWATQHLDYDLQDIFAVGSHCFLRQMMVSEDIESRADIHLDESTYDCLGEILSLPRIAHLSVPLSARHLSRHHLVRGSTLRELDLHHTQLSEVGLGTILAWTCQLRRLRFWSCYDLDKGHRPDRSSIDELLDCQKLGASLQYVQNTLEDLSLSFAYFCFSHDFMGMGLHGSTRALQVLHDFKNLRNLLIPYVVLLGWPRKETLKTCMADRLPHGLSSLTITDDLLDMEDSEWSSSDLVLQMQHIVFHPQRHMQNGLTLCLRHTEEQWASRDRLELKQSCAVNHVSCRIIEASKHTDNDKTIPRPYTRREDDSRRVRGGFQTTDIPRRRPLEN